MISWNFKAIYTSFVYYRKDVNYFIPQLFVHGISMFSTNYSIDPIELSDIPFEKFAKAGFKGIVFDKDNTLTIPKRLELLPGASEALDKCRLSFKDRMVVFSNTAGSKQDRQMKLADTVEDQLKIPVLRHNTMVCSSINVLNEKVLGRNQMGWKR